MLNDSNVTDDPSRAAQPDENTMPEPRFSKMPKTTKEKNEVIDRCILGSLDDFTVLMGDDGLEKFHSILQEMPGHFDISKSLDEYTNKELRQSVYFLKLVQYSLEFCVDTVDLSDINDLFLEND